MESMVQGNAIKELFIQADSLGHIEKAMIIQNLKSLSQFERNLLGLYFYEELSVAEIASVYGLQSDFIEMKLSEVVNTLKSGLQLEQ
ncbi:MAG: hypothetical protein Kow00108_07110 [Calditrichia bacterium]